MSAKELFIEAQNLHNSGYYVKSNKILLDLNDKYKEITPILLLISGNYYKLNQFRDSIKFAKIALRNKKDNELSSLVIYLSYVGLKEYDLALKEIFRFLKSNKAVIYKDTLEELLQDIGGGYIQDEKTIKTIEYFAQINNVKLG